MTAWCLLTNKRDETLLLISGDVLQSVAGQPRPSQPLTKLTAMMFPPELSEPGVPTVHLQPSSEVNLRRKTTALGRACQGL